jgi:hypothetical protein
MKAERGLTKNHYMPTVDRDRRPPHRSSLCRPIAIKQLTPDLKVLQERHARVAAALV